MVIKFENFRQHVFNGRKYVAGFNLYRGSKKQNKVFEIPDKSEMLNQKDGLDLSLHQRFEILERYYQKNGLGASKLVFASIGFVIAQDNSEEKAFVTFPIMNLSELIIKMDGKFIHSEVAFSNYICCEKKIADLIASLVSQNKNKVKKIYAVVFDLFSTREICRDCVPILHRLQSEMGPRSFQSLLSSALTQKGYKLPKEKVGKLRLSIVMRTAGFDDAGSYGNLDNNYPMPVACKQYNGNIKSHDDNVLFHLAPKNNDTRHSYLAMLCDSELSPLYEALQVYFLRSESTITLPMLTAFANSAAAEKKRAKEQTEVKLNGELVHQYNSQKKFHLVGNFNDLVQLTSEMVNATSIDSTAINCVLHYLYNFRNSQAEITEMVKTAFTKMRVGEQRGKVQKRVKNVIWKQNI